MKLRPLFLQILTMFFIAPAVAQTTAVGSDIVLRTRLSDDGTRSVEQRVYDNGLGDVVQEVQSFCGSSLPSVIVHHEYDEYRRMTRNWLPVTSSGSGFVSGSLVSSLAQSQYSDAAPFSRTEYDAFLLSQPSAQYKAGAQWQSGGKKVSVTYSEYVGSAMYSPEDGYLYIMDNTAKFLCTRTVDEDGCWRAEYTDLNGRVMISETSQGKTYYMYNQRGDVTHVIPPILSEYLVSHYESYYVIMDTDVMMQKYAYVYRYDSQRHCIYKKLPGCEPIYYVYDRTGACILTQDGEQRQRGEWTYTIPDRFGRPCISGICHNNVSYTSEPLHPVYVYAEYVGTSATAATGGYAVHNLALGTQVMYSAAYYDSYNFIGHHGVPSSLAASSVSGFSIDSSIGRGLQTGAATAVLDGDSATGYTYSAMYYDSRYNVTQVKATNHFGGTETTCTSYSYTGKPMNTRIEYAVGNSGALTGTFSYTYDDADRESSYTVSVVKGTPATYSTQTYAYDGLGRLVSTVRPFTTGAISYSYDLHGWLADITTNSFREELFYADGPGTPRYNGNISSMRWKNDDYYLKRGYKFTYDNANRMTQAKYGESDALVGTAKFKENVQYDAHGNVTSITRYGKNSANTYGVMDLLTLTYDGNRLTGVAETATDYDAAGTFEYKRANGSQYLYDGNGSLIADRSRGIAYVTYDANSNPSRIYFTNGNETRYLYSAAGRKLRVTHYVAKPNITRTFGVKPEGSTQDQVLFAGQTDYMLGGSLVMKDGMIDRLLFNGGYAKATAISPTTYGFEYFYYNRDHLGNNREVVNGSGRVWQVTNYYPFGTPYADPAAVMGAAVQPYKYNGKELDLMHGLDTYDYGARQYDPVLARWDRMDPLCEKYYSVSPYAYCANNPMKFIDPDGKEIWIYYNDTNGHEQSFQYSVGMSCTVNNSAAQAFVNNLNTMSTNNAGKTVIDAIVKSKTKYGYVQADTRSKSGEGYFDPITKTTSINDVNNTLAFAEETFHMYQYVNNRGGRTAVNEVEAKLFSAKMNCEISEWDNGDYLKNLSGLDNSPYSKHMINLFWGGYDYDSFKGAVNSFFSGSLSGKLYKEDIGYEEGNIDSHQLIKNFLPVNQ